MDRIWLATALLIGAAVLALWLDVRLGERAPTSLSAVVILGVAAFAALEIVKVAADNYISPESPAQTMVVLFAVVLPIFVYAFLTSIWVLKLLRDALRIR